MRVNEEDRGKRVKTEHRDSSIKRSQIREKNEGKLQKLQRTKQVKLGGERRGGGQWGSRGGTNEAVDLTKTFL